MLSPERKTTLLADTGFTGWVLHGSTDAHAGDVTQGTNPR